MENFNESVGQTLERTASFVRLYLAEHEFRPTDFTPEDMEVLKDHGFIEDGDVGFYGHNEPITDESVLSDLKNFAQSIPTSNQVELSIALTEEKNLLFCIKPNKH